MVISIFIIVESTIVLWLFIAGDDGGIKSRVCLVSFLKIPFQVKYSSNKAMT